MLSNQVFYFGIVRKVIVSFGNLFSNIYIDRKLTDSVNGTTVQRLQIPLAYSNKEKWIQRLDGDPNLENNVYTTLPRMAFEITGYSYDSTRKVNKMQKITNDVNTSTNKTMQSPVPYNIDVVLYILTKTQEDGLQILEQILPTFTPEYTFSINAIPEMNIIQDVPVILNSVSVQDDYDGDFQTRRFVTHTISFTVKVNLFGGISNRGVITTVHANVGESEANPTPLANYTAVGDPVTELVTSESWIEHF